MSKKLPDNQIAFYQSPDGAVNIEVLYAQENVWLTQKKWRNCSAAHRIISRVMHPCKSSCTNSRHPVCIV